MHICKLGVCYMRDTTISMSMRKKRRILQLNRSEIGTTNAKQCRVPVWWDHAIGQGTKKNGDNYCTALKRNMRRSAHGNLEWVNLQNRRSAGSSYSHYPCCVISPAVAGCGSRSCTGNTSNWPVLYQILQFFDPPVFLAARSEKKKEICPTGRSVFILNRNLFHLDGILKFWFSPWNNTHIARLISLMGSSLKISTSCCILIQRTSSPTRMGWHIHPSVWFHGKNYASFERDQFSRTAKTGFAAESGQIRENWTFWNIQGLNLCTSHILDFGCVHGQDVVGS